jgi:predicted nucleotidyltransferase
MAVDQNIEKILKELEPEIKAINKWASSNPLVKRVHIFGSRASGKYHDDSDLDVAIEIVARKGDTNSFTTWISDSKRWVGELQPHIRYELDLERYDKKETPTVSQAIEDCSIIIYNELEEEEEEEEEE